MTKRQDLSSLQDSGIGFGSMRNPQGQGGIDTPESKRGVARRRTKVRRTSPTKAGFDAKTVEKGHLWMETS